MKGLFRFAALCAVSLPLAGQAAEEPRSGPVYVIPVNGVIERALVYMVRRGVNDALENHASAIVLDMNTPGGRVDSAEAIIQTISSLPIPTYTYVNPNAISAGAIIALGTDRICMAPGSKIGDAMPILLTPFGGVQEMPESMEEKSVSYVAGLIRATAQRKNHDAKLAEAMVRRDMEYSIGDEVISQKDRLLTLTNVEAERMVDDGSGAKRRLLSVGTFNSLFDVVEQAGGPGAATVRLEIAPEERLARWIEMFSVLLLAGGVLGLYIEFKTPGFGVPGVAGILLLAVWFWGHHVAGLAGSGELILFFAGVVLLAVEIFLIPGFGLAGMSGIVLVILSLALAMVQHPPGMPAFSIPPTQLVQAAHNLGFVLALSLVLGLVLARILPRTEAYRHLVLAGDVAANHGFTAAPQADSLVGLRGRAVTKLRPGGIADFGGRRLDVVTRGTFVEPGAEIRVAEVHGSRIVVETETLPGPGAAAAGDSVNPKPERKHG